MSKVPFSPLKTEHYLQLPFPFSNRKVCGSLATNEQFKDPRNLQTQNHGLMII